MATCTTSTPVETVSSATPSGTKASVAAAAAIHIRPQLISDRPVVTCICCHEAGVVLCAVLCAHVRIEVPCTDAATEPHQAATGEGNQDRTNERGDHGTQSRYRRTIAVASMRFSPASWVALR